MSRLIAVFVFFCSTPPAAIIAQDPAQEPAEYASILEIRGAKVFIDIGMAGDIARGDEYTVEDEEGTPGAENLFIIEEVKEHISLATVVYSAQELEVGTRLTPIKRVGLDSNLQLQTLISADGVEVVLDYRQGISRGFFTYRPFLGTQVVLIPRIQNEINPLDLLINLNIGGEINWYIWRMQIIPALAAGVAVAVPLSLDESVHFSHAGGYAEMKANYLINAKWTLGLSVGFASWIALPDVPDSSYLAISIGVGFAVKY